MKGLQAIAAFLFGLLGLGQEQSGLKGLRQQLDLVAVMITVIIAGVVGYVGINIMSNTKDNTSLASNDTFYDSQTNLTDGLESFFSQLGTVFTVIVLVVIIAYLMLLRRGR